MSEVERFTNDYFKKHVLSKHEQDVEWFRSIIPDFEPYGYEHVYANDLDRYNAIRQSSDYVTRYRPDIKTTLNDAPYLVELKSSLGWLPAIGLMINAQRKIKTFYIIARRYAVFASDLVDRSSEYFDFMRFYRRKPYPDMEEDLRATYDLLPLQCVDFPIGYTGSGYVSGDPCVHFKDGAPLESLDSFLKRIDSR